jgi:hypothetical protein
VPTPDRSKRSHLSTQIAQAHTILIEAHYPTEASWLSKLQESPENCGTTAARNSLSRAKGILSELGYPDVAAWIGEFLDADD